MTKSKKDIKRDIFDCFRGMINQDEPTLAGSHFHKEYVARLSASEKHAYFRAVKELEDKGFIHASEGAKPDLKLTYQGANLIFGGP
jgi:hypothetical protein